MDLDRRATLTFIKGTIDPFFARHGFTRDSSHQTKNRRWRLAYRGQGDIVISISFAVEPSSLETEESEKFQRGAAANTSCARVKQRIETFLGAQLSMEDGDGCGREWCCIQLEALVKQLSPRHNEGRTPYLIPVVDRGREQSAFEAAAIEVLADLEMYAKDFLGGRIDGCAAVLAGEDAFRGAMF